MRSKRKDEHVALALSQPRDTKPFDAMRIIPKALPSFDVDDVSLETTYLGQTFSYPFYINAMTGGSEKTLHINRRLARLAKEFELAMAVGSQHAALDDSTLAVSYQVVREENPEGFIIGNVNANADVVMAQKAIDMIGANALQVHINVAQELTMPEGDRHFKHWKHNIEAIVKGVNVPVIVKEVGNGLDRNSVRELIQMGVKHVDVSGRGGTNFVWIEDQRRETPRYPYLDTWGLTALEALEDNQSNLNSVEIIASGGVRSPLDVIKSLTLGASAVGISALFLEIVHGTSESDLNQFIEDLKHMMVLVGAKSIDELVNVRYSLD